ncbi:response regulator transcription factor [Myxococcota bacterium]|jgi:DNA-binding response OmpR family regulator|nr:response regulator transcription factor [Myxococcota bacterium]MBU1410362.1 response regulator transcription factor [Myxococcota bacterium]MBU1510429.1 response regulator transcription factor [Myxococcota bacterium]PKN22179.1 MAG: DNA-binding response regulator [Deltaproteobacteria bacterium HGW-Deltaproteobacteria-22]
MNTPAEILLVEDDPALLAGMLLNLQTEGYLITAAPRGKLALTQCETRKFDLIILDLMLPDIDGIDIIRTLRGRGDSTPILILSARGDVDVKVQGLQAGADDYMTKPFELLELLARVTAILRRRFGNTRVVTFGDVEVFPEERKILRAGKVVHLTPREFDLLNWFIQNPRQISSREFLLSEIWQAGTDATERTVDNFVMTLRKKLDNPRKPRHFITVRGFGYRFQQ